MQMDFTCNTAFFPSSNENSLYLDLEFWGYMLLRTICKVTWKNLLFKSYGIGFFFANSLIEVVL